MTKATSSLPAVVDADRFVPTEYVGKLEANYYCRAWNGKRAKYCSRRSGGGTDHLGRGRCSHHAGRTPLSGRYGTVLSEPVRSLIEKHQQDEDPLNLLPDLAAARALFEDFVNRYQEHTEALLGWFASWSLRDRPPAQLLEAFRRVVEEYQVLLADRDEMDDVRSEQIQQARLYLHALEQGDEKRPRQVLDLSHAVMHLDAISKMAKRIEDVRAQNAISRPQLFRVLGEMGRIVELRNRIEDPVERLKAIQADWLQVRLA